MCLLTGCTHACRMRHTFSYMRRNLPMTQILILGILPRGAWSLPNPHQWPNRLTEGIALVNNASQVFSLSALPGLHTAYTSAYSSRKVLLAAS